MWYVSLILQDLWQRIKETDFDIFFSTCFWPTTTCLFFLPSMVAGIRHMTGDQKWLQLSSQLRCLPGFRVGIRGVPTDPHTHQKSPEFPHRLVSRTLNNNEVSTIQKLLLLLFSGCYKPSNIDLLCLCVCHLASKQRRGWQLVEHRQQSDCNKLAVPLFAKLNKETFKLGPSNDS